MCVTIDILRIVDDDVTYDEVLTSSSSVIPTAAHVKPGGT